MLETKRSASLVTLATIVVAGLASAAMPAGAAPADDACAYLTKADAATALGEGVTQSEKKSGLPMGPGMTASSCGYTGSGYHKIQLNLMRLTPETAAMYKAMCAQKGKEGLTGLGETACWYNDEHEELQVLIGTTFLSIELRGLKNPTEPIKVAAKSVFARLK
ncbi:MAG TPA: hypothetical protein VFO31_12600 [Vicinamibacterales bacterium]|nr:hypothetical protein [Vicinamibacterales bacterium]